MQVNLTITFKIYYQESRNQRLDKQIKKAGLSKACAEACQSGLLSAEEQARQARQQQQLRPTPTKRPPARDGAPARVSSRQRDASSSEEKGQNPDPSEFEPEFAIGTDDSAAPSRVATPKPDTDPPANSSQNFPINKDNPSETKESIEDVRSDMPDAKTETLAARLAPIPDLPPDVKAKLRKLDRLESKYAELLRAYRTAHSRIQNIEPFEAALRENTPLTSIVDPGALVEYLSQINLKSDMVLEELKRVSTERDQFKKKAEKAESEVTRLESKLAEQIPEQENEQEHKSAQKEQATSAQTSEGKAGPDLDAAPSPKSVSSRVPSLSFFSPKPKAVSSPAVDAPEDLFSYDSEVPRLESELSECHSQIDQLNQHVNKLQADLKVARETTEHMVQTMENTSLEMTTLREAKDKLESTKARLELEIETLRSEAAENPIGHEQRTSETKLHEVDQDSQIQELRTKAMTAESQKDELEKSFQSSQSRIELLDEKLSQKDHIVKDLEDSLAMAKAAEREDAKKIEEVKDSEKRIATMQGILDTLQRKLTTADSTIAELKLEIEAKQAEFAQRPSTKVFGVLNEDEQLTAEMEQFKTREDVIAHLAARLNIQKDLVSLTPHDLESDQIAETPISISNKKKNKKKKKGKPANPVAGETEPDVPVKVSEDLSKESEDTSSVTPNGAAQLQDLENQLSLVRSEIEERDSTIRRLSSQIKDQESLQEEIETLRDDLLHQGEEHVEARDELKSVQAEKQALQKTVERLEAELAESQKKAVLGPESAEAHKTLQEQFEQLKLKSTNTQTDLEAAQQLATARFKDITDLRELLNKTQPELRSLRAEVEDAKALKDELKNKGGELNRLETKHEDLKAELKNLGKRLSEQDASSRDLQQKVEQETSMREKIEGELTAAQSEIRSAESKRQGAVDMSEAAAKDLSQAKQQISALQANLRKLEEQAESQDRQVSSLKEEISIKTALHSSSQSLVQSLRDQTHELNVQAREAASRAENLEEELVEAQRMLSERTREGQTMRMLLNQTETGSEGRIREMKERMDTALEERDRIEDEANVNSRRMMRDVEDAKNKARDAQRQLKALEDEKDELETRSKEWKRRREELERTTEGAKRELDEVRIAMKGLREALDESERQVREAEFQRSDLRRQTDDANERIEKLSRANKNLTEEVKNLQSQATTRKTSVRPGFDSGLQSSRSSIDSSTARSPVPISRTNTSTPRMETPPGAGLSQGTIDYVYLKNVLLQFLTQKDKGHQRQLIPVIGMLLHFDQKDEQKWNAAITTR